MEAETNRQIAQRITVCAAERRPALRAYAAGEQGRDEVEAFIARVYAARGR